jgi:uncharacterized protein YjbI with pentapeptide repeats
MNTVELIEKYQAGERDFKGANLTGANLRGANLTGANLTGANLRGADLRGANLTGANLRGANLTGANLTGANLRGADLYGADLTDADLRGANLTGANLTGANLTGANLTGANLYGADLYGAEGIVQTYGVGAENRMIYAYYHDSKIMFQLGCFNGEYDDAVNAVIKKYDTDKYRKYLKPYLATLEAMKLTLEAQLEIGDDTP